MRRELPRDRSAAAVAAPTGIWARARCAATSRTRHPAHNDGMRPLLLGQVVQQVPEIEALAVDGRPLGVAVQEVSRAERHLCLPRNPCGSSMFEPN